MPSQDRRAAARRRAWGRGPIILKFEPLEGRQLLSAKGLPDLVASSLNTVHNADWGDTIDVTGTVLNQGRGTARAGYSVEVLVSTTPQINRNSVKIDEFSMPGGLAPGQSASFDRKIALPSSPIPGFGTTTGAVFVGLWVNPKRKVRETNYHNDEDLGPPYDTSPIAITPQQPALLTGTSLTVNPNTLEWGNSFQIYTQIHNNAQGNAAPTVARVVLTPAGSTFGGPNDVTVGTFNVPAIPAWQTVNVVGSVTLPNLEPSILGANTQFTLTVVPDSTYVTNTVYPGVAPQGPGKDQSSVTVNPNPNITTTRGPLPDLAATTVSIPSSALIWGQSFPVSTTIQNIGQGDAGAFNVLYLLVGPSGSTTNGIVLADVPQSGLAAGASLPLSQTLSLPPRVPNGLSLSAVTVGRIAVLLDPQDALDEVTHTDNTAFSGPATVRVVGTNGSSTVPTGPPILLTQSVTAAPATKAGPKLAQHTLKTTLRPGGKIHRRATKHTVTFTSIEHNLTIFPSKVTDLVKNIFK
jgi:hypothetical protein